MSLENDAALQSWAALEESQGAYVRASELRNYSLQEQTAVVVPSNFVVGESKSTLAPVFKQVGSEACHVKKCLLLLSTGTCIFKAFTCLFSGICLPACVSLLSGTCFCLPPGIT